MLVAAGALVGALTLAAISWRGAYRFLPSLNLARPALADVAPAMGVSPPRLARRVVLVVADGLRLDTSYGLPTLDRLRQVGVDARARSHFPTLSRPNYVSILTGVDPSWSGVRTNDYDRRVPLDSLMARARAAGLRVAFATDEARSVPTFFAGEFDAAVLSPWADGVVAAGRIAIERGDELVILILTDADKAGHAFGAASPAYRQAARTLDRKLGEILASGVDLSRDAVVVVADHGHVDPGGHGGNEPEVLYVPLVLAGAGVEAGATVLGARLIDVAPTVAALLGIPAPGHALGRTLLETLAHVPAQKAALALGDAERHARIEPVARAVANEQAARSVRVRMFRFAALAAALGGLVAFTAWVARRRIVVVDRRVLVIAVPAFPLTFYGLVAAFEKVLSPSLVPDRGTLVDTLFFYGTLAAIAHLGASWYALAGREVPRDRLAAAAGLALVGLLVAVAPAGAAWALGGEALAIALPGPSRLVMTPVTYSVVSCYAASAALVLAIEYVVFLSRASDPARARAVLRAAGAP